MGFPRAGRLPASRSPGGEENITAAWKPRQIKRSSGPNFEVSSSTTAPPGLFRTPLRTRTEGRAGTGS